MVRDSAAAEKQKSWRRPPQISNPKDKDANTARWRPQTQTKLLRGKARAQTQTKLLRGKARVAALYCKMFSAFAKRQCTGRVMHDIQRDSPRMQTIAHIGHSSSTQLVAPPHDAGIMHFNLTSTPSETLPSL